MSVQITARSLADAQQAELVAGEAIQPTALSGLPEKSVLHSRVLRRSLRWTRRNFSSRARLLSGGEVVILSAPKSGRTWIRTFLCAYLCKRYGLEFTLQPGQYDYPGFPRVIFSHDRFEHRTKGNRWDRLRGKYLVPRRELRRAKIVLLVRDPRDCFVSLYLQMTRRDPSADAVLKQKSVSELLRDERFGIRGIVRAMNDWLDEFSGRKDFMIVRYEALRATPAEHFRDLLAVVGETTPDMSIFQEALEFSRFENMQKLEAAGVFDSKILHPGDVRDPESFKVRRGKVGGYREYLSAGDLEYAADALMNLDPRFGYAA
ncbi:MAG: sulfotransferase domain-containing protein [Verrucomicrobia bacterium]|nr:sulfotransferase domain-containing protein [Verrucomicrobiota bacterium]